MIQIWKHFDDTSNTQEAIVLPDNTIRNSQDDGRSPINEDHYSFNSSSEDQPDDDPWKPPDYNSVTAMDTLINEKTKPRQIFASEIGQGSTDDLDDPPPPYPGV
ncbi:uncharacterized protein LOC123529662 isoform X2 [Mercenaria mercenaria]|uniref:uncharacterized protein LOC123529662 isoform X2 n=1 Tax=Mercenaria mercenaria TaxID=6596 RepID=UPI00234F0BCD|nr:uncharacterized protein LOC123529662 isoform X2 [Mercenaria mercenaria]